MSFLNFASEDYLSCLAMVWAVGYLYEGPGTKAVNRNSPRKGKGVYPMKLRKVAAAKAGVAGR
jgi:hypothetical protein